MGGSCTTLSDREAKAFNDQIERSLREDARRLKDDLDYRILLLGTSGSGKTTFVKQMRLFCSEGFTEEERLATKQAGRIEVINCMRLLMKDLLALESLSSSSLPTSTSMTCLSARCFERDVSKEQLWWMSPMEVLPNELLAHIFTFCQNKPTFRLVCRRWRAVSAFAVNRPRLAEDNRPSAEFIARLVEFKEEPSNIDEIFSHLLKLEDDPAVCYALQRRHMTGQFSDSAQYFLEHLRRIAAPDYEPTLTDFLHARSTEKTVVETRCRSKSGYKCVELPQSIGSFRKVLPMFEDVHAIAYFVSLSDFDLFGVDDQFRQVNKLHMALELFDTILQEQKLHYTQIFLMLNKADLFREKIKRGVDLSVCFPDYDGGLEFDKSADFVRQKFLDKANATMNDWRRIYSHFTDSTNLELMKFVDNCIQERLQVIHTQLQLTSTNAPSTSSGSTGSGSHTSGGSNGSCGDNQEENARRRTSVTS